MSRASPSSSSDAKGGVGEICVSLLLTEVIAAQAASR
jgi:hypothetical protein